jgi:uncharacterized damage-inducible protein DinB
MEITMGDNTLLEPVYGQGAHADPVACVEDISATLAARTVAGYPHSIWQIVEHMNYWMEYEVRKIAGENPSYPDHAIESWPAHPPGASEDEWQATVARFSDLLASLASLVQSDSATLERAMDDVGPGNSRHPSTMRALLWQITVHNSYHVGQIALLRRQMGVWPPRRGGFAW